MGLVIGLVIKIIRVPRWVPMDDVLLEVFWAEGQEGMGQLRCSIRYSPFRHALKYGKQRFPFFC